MSILIRDMEMPTSCGTCRFFAWSRGVGQHCAVASDITFHATIDGMDVAYERNGDCPLVPVPEHGDLIDASTKVTVQTYDDMYEEYRDEECTIAEALDRWSNEGCPEVIIPASEEGET